MYLALICLLVFILYFRTLDYHYVIDDQVKRNGYMYVVPLTGPSPDHWNSKPPKLYRVFMIGMHCVNVSVIYLLWGWAPALLFAVHPIGVWGTAWVTGNYYATTAYFCLIAYYLLTVFPNAIGALGAMALFTAALNSTVCCISFPFIFLFPVVGMPWGLSLFFPLIMYLRGKRFTTGIETRLSFNRDKRVNAKITWRRLILMTKVVARYIYVCFVPEKQGFFRLFGRSLHDEQKKYDWAHKANPEFWGSLALCLVTFGGGLIIHPVGTLWFFGVIMLHSQWNLTGQFFAERYAYLPIVGLCVVAGTALQGYPIIITAVATYLAYRTHKFIPVWENQECVWRHDVEAFPENASTYNNLAQWYMNCRGPDNTVPVYRINEIAMLLQKALTLDPNAWEIHMNMACFQVLTNNMQGGLQFTKSAIAILEPIGGGSIKLPLSKLKEQEVAMEKKVAELQKQEQPNGAATVSPPEVQKEEHNGKSETKKEGGVLESIGASGA